MWTRNIVKNQLIGRVNKMPTLNPYRSYDDADIDATAKQKEHIILLVDASGSMSGFTEETRKTIYSIIKDSKPDIHFTLIFFDTLEYKVVCDDYIRNICPELGYLYKANGGTPITDSVYKAIQDITNNVNDIELLSDKHKFVIFTDGEENASKFVKSEDLGRAIEHFTENFGWDFQFIGPKSQERGIKAYTDSIKIKSENVTLYASMSEGLEEMKNKTIN